jgi:hypothetical protein
MILFRLDLDLTLVGLATCDVLTGEGVETEGSRIPDANADEVGVRVRQVLLRPLTVGACNKRRR